MYQVPGTDIVFACIMCALCMALAFIVGGLWSTSKVREQIKEFEQLHELFNEAYTNLQDQFVSERNRWDNQLDKSNEVWAEFLSIQKRDLSKKHREDMKKYRAKCDRQVVHHMETYTANQQVQLSGLAMPDFSALLSK